jgi:hypothetical protein
VYYLVRMPNAAAKSLQVEMRDPRSLTPYIKNNKVHTQAEVDQLAGLISAFGFDQPIVIDSAGVIVKGHKRREAALQLGLKIVPVVVSDKDEYQNMANRLADNFSVGGAFDMDKIAFDVGTLQRNNVDLRLTAMSADTMSGVLARLKDGIKPLSQELRPPPLPRSRETEAEDEPPGDGVDGDGFEDDGCGDDYPPPPDSPDERPAERESRPDIVAQYTLLFDSEAQQQRWYRFSAHLKDTYIGETLAARLDAFLLETFEADGP